MKHMMWIASLMCAGMFLSLSIIWLNLALAFAFLMVMLATFMLEETIKKECEQNK